MSVTVSAGTTGVSRVTKEEVCPYIGTTSQEIQEQRNKIMRPIRASKNARTSGVLFSDLTDLEKFCTGKGAVTSGIAGRAWARTKEYFATSRMKNASGKPLSFPQFVEPVAAKPTPPGFGPGYQNAVAAVQGNRSNIKIPVPIKPMSPAVPDVIPVAKNVSEPDLDPAFPWEGAAKILDRAVHEKAFSTVSGMPSTPTLPNVGSGCPPQAPCAPCPIRGIGGRRKTRVRRSSYKKRKTLKRRRYRK